MGKQSKRKGKEREKVRKSEPFLAKFDDGKEVIMPPECPGWKTHAEALKALEKDGWHDAKYAAGFESRALCEEVRSQLMNKNVEVMDATDMVPKGPNGSHAKIMSIGYTLDKESKAHKNRAILMLRTKENTPAFVGGTTFGYIASYGSREEAIKVIDKGPSPSLIVFYDGDHMQLPTVCVQGTEKLCGKIVAAMIDRREEAFCCCICQDSFLEFPNGGQVSMKSFVATDCDHAFHTHCIMDHFRGGGDSCPMCRGPLPMEWVPVGEKPTPQSDDPFKQPKCIGAVHDGEERDRAGYLNALAEQVRQAALEDGIEGVPSAPRPL